MIMMLHAVDVGRAHFVSAYSDIASVTYMIVFWGGDNRTAITFVTIMH